MDTKARSFFLYYFFYRYSECKVWLFDFFYMDDVLHRVHVYIQQQ